jgi:hypothetical protein
MTSSTNDIQHKWHSTYASSVNVMLSVLFLYYYVNYAEYHGMPVTDVKNIYKRDSLVAFDWKAKKKKNSSRYQKGKNSKLVLFIFYNINHVLVLWKKEKDGEFKQCTYFPLLSIGKLPI